MGLLFEKSEKKVAHTMTVVEMTRKYESEIATLEEENQRLSERVEKLDDFKTKINTRMHNLKNSVAKHPDKLKEHELDTFKWLWEALK